MLLSQDRDKKMHHKRTESQAGKLNDVIIIGAGLSGLSAAKVCHDKGLNVLVLEARDRVGGRTLSDESGCDLGGSYFVQDHRNLINLIAELGLKCQADVPAAIGGVPAFYSNATKSKHRCEDSNQVPFASRFNLLAKLDYLATKRRINELCVQVDLCEPWKTKNANDLDSTSFKQFIETTCYTAQVKTFFLNFITPINLTNEAEDCSLLFALCFIRSWGGIDRCIGVDSSGTSRVVGGSQLLSTRLSQQIGEERVLLNKPVHTVDQQTNSEQVTVITKDGSRYEASRVIVALPPNLQTTITFKPNIPLKSQLNHRTPAGLCTKVILYYDRAYWYDNGFNGHLFVIDHKQPDEKRSRNCSRLTNSGQAGQGPRRSTVDINRRSICKTSSSSEKDIMNESMYASTNSLLAPPLAHNHNGGGGGGGGSVGGPVGDHIMLKETKESFYPQSGQNILDENYCPVSFATPDYSRGQPSLIAHVCGAAWIKYHQIEKQEDRIALVAKSYGRILHPRLMEPLAYKELNWVSEEYSRGAYTSIMTPGTMTKFGRALGAPFGRIAFACTEISTYWPGTMEGAIRAGRKAALKILKDLQRVDVDDEDILDDEEVPVQLGDTLIEKHSNKLLYLAKLALNTPTLLLVAAVVGIHFKRMTFRYSICI